MKRLIFLLTFLPTVLIANPLVPGVSISEIFFNETGEWVLEIYNVENWVEYLDSLVLKCNSGEAKIVAFITADYIVVTNDNLSKAISFNKSADCIKLYSYMYDEYVVDSVCIGDITGSYLKNISNGQSVSRLYGYGPFYKDNSPTIGYANDLNGSLGKIYGYFYEADETPIENKYFFINEGYSGNIEIDENGFYCAEITSRSYLINQRKIYESSTNHVMMDFENVSFELNEHDSININFKRTLTSTNTLNKDDILLSSYPNPATNSLYFITSIENQSNSPLTISVYSIDGQLIDSFMLTSEQHRWNCSNLSRGTYIYTLSQANKILGTNKFQVIK